MKPDYNKKIQLKGVFGEELERIWKAIKANQVQPSPGVKVTRTPGGTTVKPVANSEE